MAQETARNTVLNILVRVFEKDLFFQDAFDRVMAEEKSAGTERAYITRFAKGVTERYVTLHAMLSRLSHTPPEKIRPVLRLILYMGLYELFFMDTAEHAAVNETVRLCEKRGFHGLKGFANGILRNAQRQKETLVFALTEAEKAGLPDELYGLLTGWYGEALTKGMCTYFLQEKSGLTVRRMTSRISKEAFLCELNEEGAAAVPTGIIEASLTLSGAGNVEKLKAFREGHFYVQDLSSSLDAEVLYRAMNAGNISAEDRDCPENGAEEPAGAVVSGFAAVPSVLDVCAAPGGKSIDLYDLFDGKVRITACDLTERKAALIRENLARLGFEGIETRVQDASVNVPEFNGAFDAVIADVPCSGLGIIGKKPDIRRHFSMEGLGELETLQGAILENVSRYVKPGGSLLYSTCTLNPGENGEQIERFLRKHPEFESVPSRDLLPAPYRKFPEELPALQNAPGCLILPGFHPSDGFYICLLRKSGEKGEKKGA